LLAACALSDVSGAISLVIAFSEANRDMIEFAKGCGFEVTDSPEGTWLKIITTSQPMMRRK
jgi:hypothetical protein